MLFSLVTDALMSLCCDKRHFPLVEAVVSENPENHCDNLAV
jgi:hypothetical protein